MKPKANKYEAQKWVIKAINSCTDFHQLMSARRLTKNYRIVYDLCLIDELCLEIRQAFITKENELFIN